MAPSFVTIATRAAQHAQARHSVRHAQQMPRKAQMVCANARLVSMRTQHKSCCNALHAAVHAQHVHHQELAQLARLERHWSVEDASHATHRVSHANRTIQMSASPAGPSLQLSPTQAQRLAFAKMDLCKLKPPHKSARRVCRHAQHAALQTLTRVRHATQMPS